MKKSLLLAIVCVLTMFGTLKAQNTEVVIDGTVGSYSEYMCRYAPIFVGVQYSISQQYYTAEEMGVKEGSIKSLAFKTEKSWKEDNPRRLEVYLVNTDKASFNGLNMEQITSEDLVFSGNVKFEANSWVTIKFDKSFNYTGGNVLLCVNDLSGMMCASDSWFTSFSVPAEDGTRCLWHRNETIPFDPTASAIVANAEERSVPYVKFIFGDNEEPEEPEEPEQPEGTEVVIDGTVGSYSGYMCRYAPIFVGVQYSISQQYYTAEEIGVVDESFIKSLAFKTEQNWNEENPRRLEVYLANTDKASFNGLNMEQLTSDNLVFSGNVKFEANKWVTIEFDKYFNYTGGNVLLCVNDLSGMMCTSDGWFTSFSVPAEDGTRCLWHRDETIPFDPTASAIVANAEERSVPFVKFVFTEEDAIEEMTTSFNIYPNPVNDRLFIETEANVKEVAIYTLTGVMVGQKTTDNGQQTLSIDVTNYNSGIYFVKVVTDNGEVVKRFVKK